MGGSAAAQLAGDSPELAELGSIIGESIWKWNDRASQIKYMKELRVWLNGIGLEISSYEEAVCGLFTDLGLSHAINSVFLYREYSSFVMILSIRLYKLLEFIAESDTIEKIINHLYMLEVRKTSKNLLIAFNFK